MAIKSNKEGEDLTLNIDNGDLIKLDEVMQKWKFKDYQSFLRFSVSVFLLSDDNSISIRMNGQQKIIQPVADLLKPNRSDNDSSK